MNKRERERGRKGRKENRRERRVGREKSEKRGQIEGGKTRISERVREGGRERVPNCVGRQ